MVMTFRATRLILSAVAVLALFSNGIAAETSLRATLEKTWVGYVAACKSGQETELAKTMSSLRLGTMKNNLANTHQAMTPEIITSIAGDAPDLAKLEFVSLLEKGPTAGLVYVQDSEDVDVSGKPRVTFTFIKFVKEATGWKVDGEMNMDTPKFEDDGKKSEFNPADLPSTCQIDGEVHGAPPPITAPDVSAMLDVYCYGGSVLVTVNGSAQEAVTNQSSSSVLRGGLHFGTNSIVIDVTQTEKDASFHPEVTLRRILDDDKMAELLKFSPTEQITGRHDFVVTVDK